MAYIDKLYIKVSLITHELWTEDEEHYIFYTGYINNNVYQDILLKTINVKNYGCYFSTKHKISDDKKEIYFWAEEKTPAGIQICVTTGKINVIDEPTVEDLKTINVKDAYMEFIKKINYCVGTEIK